MLAEGSRISVSALNKRCRFRAELSVAASPGSSCRRTLFWRVMLINAMLQAQRGPGSRGGAGSRERCRAILRRLQEREKRRGSGCSACSAAVAGGCFAASKRDFTGREMPGTAASELSETPSARLGAAPAARAGLSPVPAVAGVLPGSFRQLRWCLTGGQQSDLCPRVQETSPCLRGAEQHVVGACFCTLMRVMRIFAGI